MVNLKRKQEEQGKIKMKEISIVDVENHISLILLYIHILNKNIMDNLLKERAFQDHQEREIAEEDLPRRKMVSKVAKKKKRRVKAQMRQ